MTLTPYHRKELYEEASMNCWKQDTNWTHYDMVHAIMPTETISKKRFKLNSTSATETSKENGPGEYKESSPRIYSRDEPTAI